MIPFAESGMDNSPRTSLLPHTPSPTADISVDAQAPLPVKEIQKNNCELFLSLRNKMKVYNDDSTVSCCTLELLYKITDIVLIICAGLFISSSIAYFAFYSYGVYCFHNKEQISQN